MRLAVQMMLGLLFVVPAMAQPQRHADPDWPCVQRLVPRLTATALWPTPLPEGDWRGDAEVAALVSRISPRSVTEADGIAAIAAFAGPLEPTERRRLMPLAFAGLLEVANGQRDGLIEQIRRFTRRQRDLAERARALAAELRTLPASTPAEQRTELEERRHFLAKAFDDAERTLRFACEAPVRLEGRLGAYTRALVATLPPD